MKLVDELLQAIHAERMPPEAILLGPAAWDELGADLDERGAVDTSGLGFNVEGLGRLDGVPLVRSTRPGIWMLQAIHEEPWIRLVRLRLARDFRRVGRAGG